MGLTRWAKSDLAEGIYEMIERFYTYTLLSKKDYKFYTGYTNNLKRRLQEHARGEVLSTAGRRPLLLIHYEYFVNKHDAESREVFLKSGFGRSELKKSLKKTLGNLGIDLHP